MTDYTIPMIIGMTLAFSVTRGLSPCVHENAIEATRQRWQKGFHPYRQLSPRKYKQCMERKSEAQKDTIRRERRRDIYGLWSHGVCPPVSELVSRGEAARRQVKSETPEQRRKRVERCMVSRNKTIRMDKIRLHWGMEPKSKLVKRW